MSVVNVPSILNLGKPETGTSGKSRFLEKHLLNSKKMYKITNGPEYHYGMQYSDGLNIDKWDFEPSGSCIGGGIYFSSKDILSFLDFGVWIREVTLPDGEDVYENPGTPKKWKAHRVILGPRKEITSRVICDLIDDGARIPETMQLTGRDFMRYVTRQGWVSAWFKIAAIKIGEMFKR